MTETMTVNDDTWTPGDGMTCAWVLWSGRCDRPAVGKIKRKEQPDQFPACVWHVHAATGYEMEAVPLTDWLDAHDAEVAATALRDAVPPEWNEDDHRGRTDGDNSRWDWLSGQWVERYGHRSADSVREIARFSHSMEIWFTDDLLGEPDPDAPGVGSLVVNVPER